MMMRGLQIVFVQKSASKEHRKEKKRDSEYVKTTHNRRFAMARATCYQRGHGTAKARREQDESELRDEKRNRKQ
jgi:hypothetical protein